MSTETQIALMEGHLCHHEEEYFLARPQTDTADRRRVYGAGFKAAWQAQAAEIEALKADIATYVRAASEQATEIEALRKDAERYRWLRHGDNDDFAIQSDPVVADFVYLPRNERLDELIDSARKNEEAS